MTYKQNIINIPLDEKYLTNAKAALELLRSKKNSLEIFNIAESENDFSKIEQAAQEISDNFKSLVVLGMGASSRAGATLVALRNNPFAQNNIHFIDNIDPFTFAKLLETIDIARTKFLVITKSGGTAETLAQLLVLIETVKAKLGTDAIKKHFLFIVGLGKNPVADIGKEYNIKIIAHDNVGGRFSALTSVGLLPAKVAGLDIRSIRKGANAVMQRVFNEELPEPVIGVALHHSLYEQGKTTSVMMPYADRLDAFGAWHQQLWAESLGKNGKGTTALRALGAFDQHSQLQLYLDGAADKFFTIITLNQAGLGAKIPTSLDPSLAYLNGNTIGDLMAAEQQATIETLARNNRPVRVFELQKLAEEEMGALMAHFMLETMIMAEIWGINAFDQPAVEEGKLLARQYLAAKNS